jgi:hypothetical protein
LQGHDIAGTEITISENVTIVAEFIIIIRDTQIVDLLSLLSFTRKDHPSRPSSSDVSFI